MVRWGKALRGHVFLHPVWWFPDFGNPYTQVIEDNTGAMQMWSTPLPTLTQSTSRTSPRPARACREGRVQYLSHAVEIPAH